MRIRTRVTLAFLLISLVPLLVAGLLSYFTVQRTVTQQVLSQLESLAVIQKSRVKSIIDQNLERLALVASRTQLRLSLKSFIEDAQSEYQGKMNRILGDARSSINSFIDISVLTLDGTIVASTDDEKIGTSHSAEEFFIRGQTENSTDIFFLDEDRNLRAYLSGPLYLENELLGVIAVESSVDDLLSLVEDCTGLGETGETFLAKREKNGDALFLTPLRFAPDAGLSRIVSREDRNTPITQALLKNKRLLTDASDYRGEPVLAATQYIKKTDWGLVVKIDKVEAFAQTRQLRNLLLLIVSLSSTGVVCISLYLASSITRPIINLTQVASKISEGDLSRRVEVASTGEIGVLAQAFNQMAEDLIEDITARKQAEEALKEYSERLEEMVEERTKELREAQEQLIHGEKLAALGQLAGGVGHELRNPLGVMSNAVYYLKTILPEADETTKEYLGIISSEVRAAEKIVSDLLDFSRVKSLEREETALSDLIDQTLEKQPPPESVKVTTEIPSELPPVFVDSRQIVQVLLNLVVNGYQAMPEGGELKITTRAEKSRVNLYITDTGCGISKENLKKIFEPLFTTRARGIGLGLAVSKNLMEANGGSLVVESEEGKGTTFTVILPIKEAVS